MPKSKPAPVQANPFPGRTLEILVIDSGWVVMGYIEEHPEHVDVKLASCVRKWGTSKGLGQLAIEGPQSETILDKMGTVTVQKSAIKFAILCDQLVWPSYFA